MRVHGVVVLHPGIDEGERVCGIGDWAHPHIVAFESFDEGLGHAVAFRAFDWGEAWRQVVRDGDFDGLVGGEDRAVVRQPLHRMRRANAAEPANYRGIVSAGNPGRFERTSWWS